MNKRSIVVIVVILISILLCSCLHDNRYPELTKYIKDNTEFRCFQSYIRENDNFAVFQFVDIENTQDMDEIIRAYNVYITENNDYFSNDVNGVELLFYVGDYTYFSLPLAFARAQSMDDSLVLSMLTLGNPEMDCWRISEFDGSFDSITSLTIRFLGDYYKSDLQGLDSWNSLQTIEIIDSNCSSNYEIANDIHERYPDIRVEYGDFGENGFRIVVLE